MTVLTQKQPLDYFKSSIFIYYTENGTFVSVAGVLRAVSCLKAKQAEAVSMGYRLHDYVHEIYIQNRALYLLSTDDLDKLDLVFDCAENYMHKMLRRKGVNSIEFKIDREVAKGAIIGAVKSAKYSEREYRIPDV